MGMNRSATKTSRDESIGPGRSKFWSKKTQKMREAYAADRLGRFSAIGPTDAAGELSHHFSLNLLQVCVCVEALAVRESSESSGSSSFPTRLVAEAGDSWLGSTILSQNFAQTLVSSWKTFFGMCSQLLPHDTFFGQGLNCLCLEIVIGGDECSAF